MCHTEGFVTTVIHQFGLCQSLLNVCICRLHGGGESSYSSWETSIFTVLLTDVDTGWKWDTKEILVFLDHGNLQAELLKRNLHNFCKAILFDRKREKYKLLTFAATANYPLQYQHSLWNSYLEAMLHWSLDSQYQHCFSDFVVATAHSGTHIRQQSGSHTLQDSNRIIFLIKKRISNSLHIRYVQNKISFKSLQLNSSFAFSLLELKLSKHSYKISELIT